jgi:hypothetical protein
LAEKQEGDQTDSARDIQDRPQRLERPVTKCSQQEADANERDRGNTGGQQPVDSGRDSAIAAVIERGTVQAQPPAD